MTTTNRTTARQRSQRRAEAREAYEARRIAQAAKDEALWARLGRNELCDQDRAELAAMSDEVR